MSAQFVDGWTIAQVLGEGAFGEVKLLINDDTKDVLAVKVINTKIHAEAKLTVQKEITIHRALSHPNIIKYFGHRSEDDVEYIFLEYASGGELFNKIEPDVGMKVWEAQKYFIQLISGVEYLHSRGVSHRDIKPENILLDDNDDVKLSDFGMATLFRKNGIERLLEKKCGTMPYVAPEVLLRPYKAMPADIWSCGIVLIAMLAGELPWDAPTHACKEFSSWKNNIIVYSPWSKLDNSVLNLLKKILITLPEKRLSATQILKHQWCYRNFPKEEGKLQVLNLSEKSSTIAVDHLKNWAETFNFVSCMDVIKFHKASSPMSGMFDDFIVRIGVLPNQNALSKRLFSGSELSPVKSDDDYSRFCYSQPPPLQLSDLQESKEANESNSEDSYDNKIYCFSQPAHIDDLLLSSQLHCTQVTALNTFQKLVRRMTRFFVSVDLESATNKLIEVLETLACSWKRGPPFVLTFTTIDRRKNNLIFKANIIEMNGKVLMDFRLSRGCGLEFKKLFVKIKEKLEDFIIKGPIIGSTNLIKNAVP